MIGNNNIVTIDIQECDHTDETFDVSAEDCQLYKVTTSLKDRKKTFTIKTQTVEVERLMLRRRKFIITNENNRSFESLQTDEKKLATRKIIH